MATAWATAFLAAAVFAMAGTPLLRRLALARDYVDRPASHKSHNAPVPYLGGVAIIGAALIGLLAGTGLAPRIAVVTLGACAIGAVGLLDDRRSLSPRARLIAQTGAAASLLAVGITVRATHIVAIDAVLTVVWVVGITNAFNLMDNMDGLAGGTAAATALSVFALAALGGQVVVAGLAAAVTGACLGFLAYNVRPAAIFMGDAGSLFLGFVLAVGALELDPAPHPPASFVVPLLLLAVPLLDTATVSFARLRRGRRVTFGGRDHLSHRLVARGIPPSRAVTTLVVAQLVCGLVAVAAGRGIVGLPVATFAVGAIVAALLSRTARVRVYDIPVIGFPRRLLVVGAGSLAVMAALGAPAAVAMLRARTSLQVGATGARAALVAIGRGETDRARSQLQKATIALRSARTELNRPWTSTGLAVPVLATNLRAARTLSGVGGDLVAAGQRLATTIDPKALRVRAGVAPIDNATAIAPELGRDAAVLARADQRIARIDRSYLVGPVSHAVAKVSSEVHRAAHQADRAATAAQVVPDLLGRGGPRRYFLAVQNSAELRATGGFIGNFGEVIADHGRLRLGRFGRIAELNGTGHDDRILRAPDDFLRRYGRFEIAHTWQNVNMSPDFPTVAKVITDLYPQSGGTAVDGVIGVDPVGLAALLQLTGPVRVATWPEPLTSENIVRITLHDEYETFPDTATRVEFLGAVAAAVWQALTSADLPEPSRVGAILASAAQGRHIMVTASRSEEEHLLDRLGISGRIESAGPDGLLLVNQNAAGNKVDYYLQRDVRVDVRLDPAGRAAGTDQAPTEAAVHTRVSARMHNGAPDRGLALEAIGPFNAEFTPGENRTFLSIYTRHDFQHATVDGQPLALESATELGRRVYSTFLSLPAGATRTFGVDLAGTVKLGDHGWYALDLGHQPTLHPDATNITVTVPAGWRIANTVGLRRVDHHRAHGTLRAGADHTVMVQVERDGVSGWLDQLRAGRSDN